MNRAALIATLAAACLASACRGGVAATPALEATVESAVPDSLVVLSTGMTADIAPGATLAFERIVSDSRCPAGAQCVWAGEVTIALTLVTPLGSKSFELSARNNRRAALSYAVELVSYGPCPGGPAITPQPGECASLKVSVDPAP